MSASYEDVFFYLDLIKDTLKKKDIIKVLKLYIEEKNKINIKGHYGVLIFQEKGDPIFITDKKDSNIISKIVNENWQYRPKIKSYFENGLFYIFSYIAETVRKKSKFNRIIVITDTPSDLNENYQEALFNLVSKIKFFPTFIDIIRVLADKETRFFKDDVKLNILASETKGGIFYVQDKKQFLNVIKKLVKNKQFISMFADRPDEMKISKEDYAFYNRLAKKLKKSDDTLKKLNCIFCHEKICPVCANVNDTLLLCPDCIIPFHECCVVNYTINYNIGIPHIFRCPKCDVLLQISEDLIVEVSTEDEEVTSVKDYIEMEKKEELDPSQKIKSNENVKPPESLELPSEKEKISQFRERKVRIGGYFGHQYFVKKVGDKIVYERVKKQKPQIRICPICGTSNISNEQGKCSNCGQKF
ncbi:MAG: hypothetical protein ACFFAN_21335 [Promethearchaeota archaeon]